MAELPSNLKSWARKEFGYDSNCSPEVLSSICSGPMVDVWSWILEHCNDRDHVRMVRGNLALSSSLSSNLNGTNSTISMAMSSTSFMDSERKMLLDDRSRLMSELHSVLMKVQRLKSFLENSKAEIILVENKRFQRTENIQIRRQRVALLGLYMKKANGILLKLDSVKEKMKQIVNHYSVTKTKSLISCGSGVVSEDSIQINNSVQRCSEYFLNILEGTYIESRTSLKESIVNELRNVSSENLLRGLVKHTNNLVLEIADKLQQPRCHEEMEENEVFSSQASKEITEFCRLHVTSFKESRKLEKSVESLRKKIDDLAEKIENNPETEEVKVSAMKAGLKKSLNYLIKQHSGLVNSNHSSEYLVSEQQDSIDGHCDIISSLVLKSSVHALKQHQLKTLDLLATKIPCLSADIESTSKSLNDTPSRQLKCLNSAPTIKLSSTMVVKGDFVDMIPTCHLSILRNCSKFPQIPNSIVSRRSVLVTDVIEILETVNVLESKWRTTSHRTEDVAARHVKILVRLENLLTTNIKEQTRNLMPAIDECKQRQTHAFDLLKNLKTAHQDWRNQPASGVACSTFLQWGEIEGRTMQQMIELAGVYLNKLNT